MSKKKTLTTREWLKAEDYLPELDKKFGGYFLVKDYDDKTITFDNGEKIVIEDRKNILNQNDLHPIWLLVALLIAFSIVGLLQDQFCR